MGQLIFNLWENSSLSDLPNECWEDIYGYEGYYRVSNLGRVKSLERSVYRKDGGLSNTKTIIKKQRLVKEGYLTVYLFDGLKYSNKLVHVLVGRHFIPNPGNKKEINHKKGIKTDNRATELEWNTTSENIKHAYSLGIMSQKGEKHASNKLKNNQVLEIFNSTESQPILAKRYNMSRGTISNIKVGVSWSHITGKFHKSKINDSQSSPMLSPFER